MEGSGGERETLGYDDGGAEQQGSQPARFAATEGHRVCEEQLQDCSIPRPSGPP